MIKDSEFYRLDGVPITKEEIRAISVEKLNICPEDIILDIGCGSGGMTVEISKRCKFVYAVDGSKDAIDTTLKNMDKFNVKNCEVYFGDAKDLISNFKVNKAFIGGTQNIESVIEKLNEKNVRNIVINTIVLENSVKVIQILERLNFSIEVISVLISYGKRISSGHMMLSKNPITIITAKK
ncbi:precorrin-6Y C5,15-methyltransferase (decarboxylating), CbiT subunit [Methanococcus vannielii SB]|uniref:Probable cobalt-precorrin-6B C(15)-methyltransferase (decarboxylating) n=1 Tax=Methanococcus vannielii (strain ATCC 35089 / DSM 1224 / JCM 13029 / OCM 148 / SB) TaxID=406327 RepID=CBIT_METVS|nr:precorrin-6Y C5,15-methyltransferase (decarboxylating) subunit CbiT [Methanococcus vannielii]A6UPM1.1 RecName: Full=Probable cobalt-precorrin-6B C(15)-methyltransferase (decarboxylating) [Methanococcus vannielii SB]ABR54443.1 precorrin-6Y C5,15-methyltransferase (decarboxylating), CbiT subunit [Methanococcus vannielii SB]